MAFPLKLLGLLAADIVSLVAVLWFLLVYRLRLSKVTRERPFTRLLAHQALSDLIMVVGTTGLDLLQFTDVFRSGQLAACQTFTCTIMLGRNLSIFTEIMLALMVAVSTLRKVRLYSCMSSLWLIWLVGGTITAADFATTTFPPPSDATEETPCYINNSLWPTVFSITLGCITVSMCYITLAWHACRELKSHFHVTAIGRTFVFPMGFFITFGPTVMFREDTLMNKGTTVAVAVEILERMNGFVNVVTYSFGLVYCSLCGQDLARTGLAVWDGDVRQVHVEVQQASGKLDAAVLNHICYFEGTVLHGATDARDESFRDSSSTSDLGRGRSGSSARLPFPSQGISNIAPLLGPSINAFRVRGLRLVLEPPTLEHLFIRRERVGQGSYGDVSLMTCTTSYRGLQGGEQYAVKCIKGSTMRRAGQALRYIRQERDTLLRASAHPGIVCLYESFIVRSPERCWILVMEFCAGGSLQAAVSRDGDPGLALDLAQRYSGETIDAIAFLHGLRIMHRDLKPGNVLLSHEGRCKLADFGVAVEQTRARSIQGTLRYMAPEVLTLSVYSAAADIYSWGRLVLCLFVGTPAPAEWGPGVTPRHALELVVAPASLVDVVLQAMAEEPSERPPATELRKHPLFAAAVAAAAAETPASFGVEPVSLGMWSLRRDTPVRQPLLA